MQAVTPFKELAEAVREAGGEKLDICYQCGLCTGSCPWNQVRKFLVRKTIHQAQLGVVSLESEDTWLCTTCGTCVERCPQGVDIINIMRAMRRLLVPDGVVPSGVPNLRAVMTSIASEGNPWRQEAKDRANWAKDLHVKAFTKDTELLYFPCCTTAYDPRVQNVARATAGVLSKLGVDFGILGDKENCCGESVRKAGNESLFRNLSEKNTEIFIEAGVKEVLVSSPHCFHTFKNEYSDSAPDFKVMHTVQYLAKLVHDDRLKFSKEVRKRVTYHDSCYLGRHNGIYDEPREILQNIPGIEIVEMAASRENALCCGGGGGRIWLETPKEERFSDLRIQQAIDAGAEMLLVSCPYCMLMFEDSLATNPKAGSIQVKDLTELVAQAI